MTSKSKTIYKQFRGIEEKQILFIYFYITNKPVSIATEAEANIYTSHDDDQSKME